MSGYNGPSKLSGRQLQANAQEVNLQKLQSRALADLSKRARGGIVIYLLAWLVVTLPSAIHATHALFFYLNSGFLIGIMLLRLVQLNVDVEASSISLEVRRRWLVWGILAGALHWGLMTAWVVTYREYASIEFHVIAAAAVLGIAGTAALSIAHEIRHLYSPFILGPLFIALVARGSADDLILAAMALLAVAYITVTAKTASLDYWQAIGNEQLAEQRALQMEKLSHTDQLTQLNNRSFFDRRLGEEWRRASRQKAQVSILMLDLDHFKALNDNYGHLFGDRCLQEVAGALNAATMRETDVLARYGGEEFVVLLPDTGATSAALIGERLRAAVAGCEIVSGDKVVPVSCSVGGATMQPRRHLDAQILLAQADAGLYQAKALGRNRYVAHPHRIGEPERAVSR